MRPAHMTYPLSLDLTDRLVVVVGAGRVGARRAQGVLEGGGRVLFVAPTLGADARALLTDPRVAWTAKGYDAHALEHPERVWLVHAATDDAEVNAEVARDADTRGIWCVRADNATRSAAWTPAVARGAAGGPAEGLTIAVTGDRDPRRAVAVRDAVMLELEHEILPVRRRRVPAI